MRVDHLVYAASDLDADAHCIARALGVEPSDAVEYPHLGIEARYVPMGAISIEVAIVRERGVAAATAWTRWLAHWCETSPGFVSWAVDVDDIDAVAERLDRPVRVAPDGTFSTVGLDESFEARYLPFFISWSPSRARDGQVGDWIIEQLEMQGDADVLRGWMDGADTFPVEIAPGSLGITAVRARRGQDRTTLRSASAG